jgi:hypothetical protein
MAVTTVEDVCNACAGAEPVSMKASRMIPLDVAEGEKIPCKGGPGITRSDLLVINKIDLAPLVGADLEVTVADARRMRLGRAFVFTNLKRGEGADQIANFVIEKLRSSHRSLEHWTRRSSGLDLGSRANPELYQQALSRSALPTASEHGGSH